MGQCGPHSSRRPHRGGDAEGPHVRRRATRTNASHNEFFRNLLESTRPIGAEPGRSGTVKTSLVDHR